MASAIAYLFGRDPRPSRHERIPGTPQDEIDIDIEEGGGGGQTSAPVQIPATDASPPTEGVAEGAAATTTTNDEGMGGTAEETGGDDAHPPTVPDLGGDGATDPDAAREEDPAFSNDDPDAPPSDPDHERIRRYMTARRLAELEEERELRRRRHSTCTLIAVFLLFRLWVQALADGDVGLLLLSLVGTSWTARWVQTRREAEDEIDRAIEEYVRQADAEVASGGPTGRTLTASARARASAIEAADLRLMSFQAQLALAILESQRQMMENGGYGRPEDEAGQPAGLDDAARGRWTRYSYQHGDEVEKPGLATPPPAPGSDRRPSGRNRTTRAGYGSVSSIDEEEQQLRPEHDPSATTNTSSLPSSSLPPSGLYDLSLEVKKAGYDGDDGSLGQPSCSICLCEYEEGEGLAMLPCGHTYHEECVNAWVANHVRCPLCNFDLREEHPSELNSVSASTVEESIV